jgi:hypothetical protein
LIGSLKVLSDTPVAEERSMEFKWIFFAVEDKKESKKEKLPHNSVRHI